MPPSSTQLGQIEIFLSGRLVWKMVYGIQFSTDSNVS